MLKIERKIFFQRVFACLIDGKSFEFSAADFHFYDT